MSIEIIFCITAFIIMFVLLYKLNKIVKQFDDILGEQDA